MPDRQWGWMTPEGTFRHIYPSAAAVSMCFAEGIDEAVSRGKGRLVEVEIREVDAVEPNAEGKKKGEQLGDELFLALFLYVRRLVEEYDVGDRPMSPPAALLKVLRLAEELNDTRSDKRQRIMNAAINVGAGGVDLYSWSFGFVNEAGPGFVVSGGHETLEAAMRSMGSSLIERASECSEDDDG